MIYNGKQKKGVKSLILCKVLVSENSVVIVDLEGKNTDPYSCLPSEKNAFLMHLLLFLLPIETYEKGLRTPRVT